MANGARQTAAVEDPRPAHQAQGLGLHGLDQRRAGPPVQGRVDPGRRRGRAGQGAPEGRARETKGPRYHAGAGGRALPGHEGAGTHHRRRSAPARAPQSRVRRGGPAGRDHRRPDERVQGQAAGRRSKDRQGRDRGRAAPERGGRQPAAGFTSSPAAARSQEEWGELKIVPRIRTENEPQGRLRWLTQEEATKVLAACKKGRNAALADLVEFCLFTGVHRGETLGLTWDRVDRARGVIRLEVTKSGRRREVPLSSNADAVLARRWTPDAKGLCLREPQLEFIPQRLGSGPRHDRYRRLSVPRPPAHIRVLAGAARTDDERSAGGARPPDHHHDDAL